MFCPHMYTWSYPCHFFPISDVEDIEKHMPGFVTVSLYVLWQTLDAPNVVSFHNNVWVVVSSA